MPRIEEKDLANNKETTRSPSISAWLAPVADLPPIFRKGFVIVSGIGTPG